MDWIGLAILVFWHLGALAWSCLAFSSWRKTRKLGPQIDALRAEVGGLRVQVATLIGALRAPAESRAEAPDWNDDFRRTQELGSSRTRLRIRPRG